MMIRRIIIVAAIIALSILYSAEAMFLVPVALLPTVFAATCTIFTDDFSANDIASYTQDSGSWSIASNQLVPPTTGRITLNTAAAAQGVKFSAAFNFAGASGTARWIVDYVDASNYHFAEVICTGSTAATLRIWKRKTGTETAVSPAINISGFSWSAQFTISICFSATSFTALFDATNWRMATVDDNGGLKCGLSTSSVSSSARFDDLSFTVLSALCSSCTITAACNTSLLAGGDFSGGTPLGSYTQVTGAWTYSSGSGSAGCSSGRVTSTGTSSALLIGTTDLGSPFAVVSAVLNGIGLSSVGQKARIIGAYQDSGNYLFAEAELTAFSPFTTWTHSIYERRGGSNTLLATQSISGAAFHQCTRMSLCWDGVKVSSAFEGNSMTADSDMIGYSYGFGTDGGAEFYAQGAIVSKVSNSSCDCLH